jgi:hypothetical protein
MLVVGLKGLLTLNNIKYYKEWAILAKFVGGIFFKGKLYS